MDSIIVTIPVQKTKNPRRTPSLRMPKISWYTRRVLVGAGGNCVTFLPLYTEKRSFSTFVCLFCFGFKALQLPMLSVGLAYPLQKMHESCR